MRSLGGCWWKTLLYVIFMLQDYIYISMLFVPCYHSPWNKHVGIICPPDNASKFHKYEGFYSIVLLSHFSITIISFWLQKLDVKGELASEESIGTPPLIWSNRKINRSYQNHNHFLKAQTLTGSFIKIMTKYLLFLLVTMLFHLVNIAWNHMV